MNNHLHLLIKEGTEIISQIMKRIGTSYVYWYNSKYERYGHLFQDRYKSEAVEDDKYLLTVLRYIHQNPIKAGIVDEAAEYKWSSYSEYIRPKKSLADVDFILSLFNPDRNEALKIFEEFMTKESKEECLEHTGIKRKILSDEEVKKLVLDVVQSDNIQVLRQMNRKERDKIVRELKEKDISIRQLARITGLTRRVVEKA